MRPQVNYIQSVCHWVISLFGRVDLGSNLLTLPPCHSSYKVHLPKVCVTIKFFIAEWWGTLHTKAITLTEFSLDLFLWDPLTRIHLNLILRNKPTELRRSLFLRNGVTEFRRILFLRNRVTELCRSLSFLGWLATSVFWFTNLPDPTSSPTKTALLTILWPLLKGPRIPPTCGLS